MEIEHIPSFPADAKNLNSLISFVGNIKEREKWMKRATEVIAHNEKLLATLGKANEIEKLHAEAAELKEAVLSAIEKREKALAEHWKKYEAEMTERSATLKQQEHDAGARATLQRNEARALLSGAQQKDKDATEALKLATKAQDQAESARDAARILREELQEQRDQVKQLAKAVA